MRNSSSHPRCMLGTTEARRRLKAGGRGLPRGRGGNFHRWGGGRLSVSASLHATLSSSHSITSSSVGCSSSSGGRGLFLARGRTSTLLVIIPTDGSARTAAAAALELVPTGPVRDGRAGSAGGAKCPPPLPPSEHRKSHWEHARTRLSRCFIPLM